MAVRPIVKFPDPVLTRPTKLLTEITDEIRTLVADMWETMYAAPGVGLAANQVGVPLRLAVIDTLEGDEPGSPGTKIVLVNPVLLEKRGRLYEDEGCLSFPGFTERVERPSWARVKAFDLEMREFDISGGGLLGRALCHETDHLNGMLYVDHLRGFKRDRLLKKVAKLQKNGMW